MRLGHLWRRIDAGADKILFYFGALTLTLITGLVFYTVVLRYLFNAPPLWSEEVPRLFFIWLTFMAAILATRRGMNIRVTYFFDKFPPRAQITIEATMHVLVLLMLAVLFVYSLPIVELSLGNTILSTGWSDAWTYIALPVGCLFMAFYQTILLGRTLARYK